VRGASMSLGNKRHRPNSGKSPARRRETYNA
jgi:hypothetical protein